MVVVSYDVNVFSEDLDVYSRFPQPRFGLIGLFAFIWGPLAPLGLVGPLGPLGCLGQWATFGVLFGPHVASYEGNFCNHVEQLAVEN